MNSQQPTARLRPFRPVQFGRYTLLAQIGVGGMGEIYLARMEGVQGFEKLCVIKKILPTLAAEGDFLNRFVSEARVLGRLAHGSIAQVLDVGLVDGEPYIALEHVDGKDLRKVAGRMRERHLPPPLTFVLFVMGRVLDALAYAHRKRDDDERELNLVHRDISPQNILVSYEGEVKVIDFGLAKSTLSVSRTHPSIVLGKFLYMAPEQARHQQVDRRSDLYSVGLCMYELIAGRNPFDDAPPGELMARVADPRIPPLQEVDPLCPASVSSAVMKAIAVEPNERFQTAEEFRNRVLASLHEIDNNAGPETVSKFMRETFASEYQAERRLLASLKDTPKAPGSAPTTAARTETGVHAMQAMKRLGTDPGMRRGSSANRTQPPPPARQIEDDEVTEHDVPVASLTPAPSTGPRLVPKGNVATDAYADTNPRVILGTLIEEEPPSPPAPAPDQPRAGAKARPDRSEATTSPVIHPDAQTETAAPLVEPTSTAKGAASRSREERSGRRVVLLLLLLLLGLAATGYYLWSRGWVGESLAPPREGASEATGQSPETASSTAQPAQAQPEASALAPEGAEQATEEPSAPDAGGDARATGSAEPATGSLIEVSATDPVVAAAPLAEADAHPEPAPLTDASGKKIGGKKRKRDPVLNREWSRLKATFEQAWRTRACSQKSVAPLCDRYRILRADLSKFDGSDPAEQEQLLARIRNLEQDFEQKRPSR